MGIRVLATSDTNLFAGTYNGVFRSTDNGARWINISLPDTGSYQVNFFAVDGWSLFPKNVRERVANLLEMVYIPRINLPGMR